jgi:ribosomal protein S2
MGDREIYEIKDAKKGMLKYLVPSKRRQVGAVTLAFLMGIRAHHGKGFSLKSPPISPYLIFCLNERTVLNINLSVYELRRLFLGLKLRCAWKETLIMNVPVKTREISEKLKKIAGGFFHFFNDWVGGTLTNFRFFFRYIRRLGAKINATSLFLSKESKRLLKEERNLKGIGNVQKMPQVPSVFIGFGTAHWPLNEAVSLGLQTFLFIDADYKGQFANGLIPFGNSLMTIEKIMEIFVLSIGEIKLSEKFFWLDYPQKVAALGDFILMEHPSNPGKKILVDLNKKKEWRKIKHAYRKYFQGVKHVDKLPEDLSRYWRQVCEALAYGGEPTFDLAVESRNENKNAKDIRYYQKGIPLTKVAIKLDYKEKKKKKEYARKYALWVKESKEAERAWIAYFKDNKNNRRPNIVLLPPYKRKLKNIERPSVVSALEGDLTRIYQENEEFKKNQ